MPKTQYITLLLALMVAAAACTPQRVDYVVTDYGATPDTTRLSTEAIQRAIDKCAAHGGGTVTIPAGDYLVSTIELKSHVNLHLESGATLYASRDTAAYRRVDLGGKDVPAQEVVLLAVGQNDISVTGTGRIHCQAVRVSYQREPVDTLKPLTDFVTGREVYNAARYGADYRTKYRKVPPCPTAINFTDCSDVHLQDFSVIESSSWGVHLQWCDRVNVRGLNIQSSPDCGVNSDGIDIDGCARVTISDCVIDTGDDALCLKTTRTDGRSMPCQYITITNCILTSSSSALKLGTESHSDFHDITVSNCVIRNANRGINFTIRDGGNVRDITFTNLTISTVRKATFWWGNGDPLWLTTQRRGDIPWCGGIENVTFSHIIARGQSGVRVENFDSRISNIRFYDFQLYIEPEDAVDKRARDGFLFVNVDGLRLTDCSVTWDTVHPQPNWGQDFVFENVKGLVQDCYKGDRILCNKITP